MESARNNGERDGSSANRSLAIIKELQQLALIDDIGTDLERAKSLQVSRRICEVNQINPTINPLEAGIDLDDFDNQVTLLQLIAVANRILHQYIEGARFSGGRLTAGP